MTTPPQYQLVYGDASRMEIIRDREVDLVVTGPPYFSAETELLLQQPAAKQTLFEVVDRQISAFAMSLRPIFFEVARVLKDRGVLVMQTKDIHYANRLIGLASIHRELAEAAGLTTFSRVFWHKYDKRSPIHRFTRQPKVGSYRADEVEEILFLSKGDLPAVLNQRVDLPVSEIRKCLSPLWHMAPAGKGRRHPHQSPLALARRVIAMFSREGDLVLDPFAGSAAILEVAVGMGRRAIGYEIEEQYARAADSRLSAKLLSGSGRSTHG